MNRERSRVFRDLLFKENEMKRYAMFFIFILLGLSHSLSPSKIFPEPTFQSSKVYSKSLEQEAYRAYLILIRSPKYQHADPQEQSQMIDSLAHPLDLTIEHFRRIIDDIEEKDAQSKQPTSYIMFQDYAPEKY